MISSIIFTYLAYAPVVFIASVALILLRGVFAHVVKPRDEDAFKAMLAFYGWVLFAASTPGLFFALVKVYANVFL